MVVTAYNQLNNIRENFNSQVLVILIESFHMDSITNAISLLMATTSAHTSSINVLAALYQRHRLAAPIQRNRLQYKNYDD